MSEKTMAFVLVVVSVGMEYDIAKEIKKIEGVKEIYTTYGSWDIVARLESDSVKGIEKSVIAIRKISGVEYTETLLCNPVA
ncbi:MAG: Lrp/AsnC ligand binding domain-containing protein [Candidatus Odinarchaeota archaeon]|nr:Lrp/AsnC ligand binding domain-containing protein [Candidatus Odinarchaeota archaeon]